MIKMTRRVSQLILILVLFSLTLRDARAEEQAIAAPAPTFDAKLTLELQGVDILDVLKILSKKSGLNIVAGKNVQGTVSIFLRDVPVMEALRTILQSQGLASVKRKPGSAHIT